MMSQALPKQQWCCVNVCEVERKRIAGALLRCYKISVTMFCAMGWIIDFVC